MNETAFNAAGTDGNAPPASGIRTILQWLELPLAPQPAEELPSLRSHLKALRDLPGSPAQRARVLDGLYTRSNRVVASLLPALCTQLVLPAPRKERRIVRSLVDLLQMLVDDLLALLDAGNDPRGPAPDLVLWRSLETLAKQLLICDLIASPARTGAWQQLHAIYATARHRQLHTSRPRGVGRSMQDIYHSTILLGCAQPASMTPPEVLFLAAYLECFADQIEPLPATPTPTVGSFWIDPERDLPAISYMRRPPPPTVAVEGFSCDRLCQLLRAQVAELDTGSAPRELRLPAFAGTPAGRGVLHRLASRWSDAGKRRFQRRRQNHRTLLTAGIDGVWRLGRKGQAANVDLSTWIITNESP
ncbi:MAG: hypothetical protein V5B07_02655, partial [Candidatus Accumulibacter sp. UW27]